MHFILHKKFCVGMAKVINNPAENGLEMNSSQQINANDS